MNKHNSDSLKNLISQSSLATQRSQLRKNTRVPPVSFRSLYKFINPTEKCYIVVGSITSFLLGAMLPLLYFFAGQIINEICPTTPHTTIGDKIKTGSLPFFYVLAPIFIFGFLSFGLWILVGERVSTHFRVHYLRAVLRQDVEWFESIDPAEIPTILNTQCELIKIGTGEKIGSILVSLGLTIANVVISFTVGWALTLVLMVFGPLILLSSYFVTKVTQQDFKEKMATYARAGGQAEQALTQLRTVAAFTREEQEIKDYNAKIKESLRSGR